MKILAIITLTIAMLISVLSIQAAELRDGHPDIYVCNDAFTPDRFYLNDGTGRFQEIPELALRQTSHFSMGIDFADLTEDHFDFVP